jgi:hypothetical protein
MPKTARAAHRLSSRAFSDALDSPVERARGCRLHALFNRVFGKRSLIGGRGGGSGPHG